MLLTSYELADQLKCSRNHITNLINEGMPATNIGKTGRPTWRFDLDKCLEWMNRPKTPEKTYVPTGKMKRK